MAIKDTLTTVTDGLKPNLTMKCSKGLKSTSNCLLSGTKDESYCNNR